MRGTYRLRRGAARLIPRAAILVYHRVAVLSRDPQSLCVTPQHFAEHLAVLAGDYTPVPLAALREPFAPPRGPRPWVALTFDDGYADNLAIAKPLLERTGVPATVFVASEMVDSPHEFWWDELEQVLLAADRLPGHLTLKIGGEERGWDLLRAGDRGPDDPGWRVDQGQMGSGRRRAYLDLSRQLKPLLPAEREACLDELFAWAGIERCARLENRALSGDELRQLAASEWVAIGGHTISHAQLVALAPVWQQREIEGGKRALEAYLGRPVRSFAYPFGGRADYTPETVRLVRRAGFEYACANFPGLAGWGTDRYQLPRLLVRDWDGAEFARRMERWFGK